MNMKSCKNAGNKWKEEEKNESKQLTLNERSRLRPRTELFAVEKKSNKRNRDKAEDRRNSIDTSNI